jgi:hypothetical protein
MMNFAQATPDALFDYAANWEDQVHREDPEDLTWVFVDAFPLNALDSSPSDWADWFARENEEADLPGYWSGLKEVVGTDRMDPLVIGLVNVPQGCIVNIWDGSHRVGAASAAGLTHLPVVLGVPPGLAWAQVPRALRTSIPAADAIAQVLGPEPELVPAPARRRTPGPGRG